MACEKVLVNYISKNVRVSRIHNELSKLNSKNTYKKKPN